MAKGISIFSRLFEYLFIKSIRLSRHFVKKSLNVAQSKELILQLAWIINLKVFKC